MSLPNRPQYFCVGCCYLERVTSPLISERYRRAVTVTSDVQLSQTGDSLKVGLKAGNGAETKQITAFFPKPASALLAVKQTSQNSSQDTELSTRYLIFG
jgi:hypothetical protein